MRPITVEQLSRDQKKALELPEDARCEGDWSCWECGPSTFDWHYTQVERAYLYEGKVKIKTAGQEVDIQAGDFVTFPRGLDCTWEVIKRVRKVFRFE